MKASYRQFIDEHEAIEHAANGLLADLGDAGVTPAELASQLDELARVVEDHIEVEDGVIAAFDPARLTGPWVTAWKDSMVVFQRLKADWVAFLGEWTRSTIERNRQGFRQAADAILGRLRERLQMETQAFYATALQTGAIELR